MNKEKLEQILRDNQEGFKNIIEFYHIARLIEKAKPCWDKVITEGDKPIDACQIAYACQIALPMTDIQLDIVLAEYANSKCLPAKWQLLVMDGQKVELNMVESCNTCDYFPVRELYHFVGTGIGRKAILESKMSIGGKTKIAIEHYLYDV